MTAIVLGAFAAAAFGVATAPSAAACYEEQCPLGCRLLSQIFGSPACPMQDTSGKVAVAECTENCGPICDLWERLGRPICEIT